MMQDRIWTLLARKVANELLPEEEKELERLLQRHPDASYINEMMMQPWKDKQKPLAEEDVNAALERHKQRLATAEAANTYAAETPVARNNIRRLIFGVTSVAAALALAFFVGRQWWDKPAPEAAQHQVVVQQASRHHLQLPDGTSVWLNAGSKLDYPEQFTDGKRIVTLEGEAYFDVAKDAARPFIVKTRSFSIRVLGTVFNVRAYPQEDSAVTSLVQGSVEVVIDEKQNHVVRLLPNEKLTIPVVAMIAAEKVKAPVQEIRMRKEPLTEVRDSVMAETAWVDNKLAFKRLPLEHIVQLFEQRYGGDIRFRNENKKQVSLTGVFDQETLTEALHALELTGAFHFEKDSDGVIWIE